MVELLLAAAVQLNAVRSVDYAPLHAREALVRIELARPLAEPASGFRTIQPVPRVVVDLPGTSVREGKSIRPERGLVRGVRLIGHARGTRLVIDLDAPAAYQVASEGTTLLITLRRTPPLPPSDRWQRFGAAPPHLLRELRFERAPDGAARILARTGASAIDVREQGRRIVVTFQDTGIEAEQRLDVLDFATPVEAVEARSRGRDAVLLVEVAGGYEYSARQADAQFVLTVTPR
ncbi:MAG: AMIN domain-containing protein [Betaproteobacteria bacterium]